MSKSVQHISNGLNPLTDTTTPGSLRKFTRDLSPKKFSYNCEGERQKVTENSHIGNNAMKSSQSNTHYSRQQLNEREKNREPTSCAFAHQLPSSTQQRRHLPHHKYEPFIDLSKNRNDFRTNSRHNRRNSPNTEPSTRYPQAHTANCDHDRSCNTHSSRDRYSKTNSSTYSQSRKLEESWRRSESRSSQSGHLLPSPQSRLSPVKDSSSTSKKRPLSPLTPADPYVPTHRQRLSTDGNTFASSYFEEKSDAIIRIDDADGGRTIQHQPEQPNLYSSYSQLFSQLEHSTQRDPLPPQQTVYQRDRERQRGVEKRQKSTYHMPLRIYNQSYIDSTFDVESVKSRQENLVWLKGPKSFLNNHAKHDVAWESFGPDDNKLHRATVSLKISGEVLLAYGDGKTKKDAEKIAYLHLLYKLESDGMLQKLVDEHKSGSRKQDSPPAKVNSNEGDPKKHVIDFCSRFDYIPDFKVTGEGPAHNTVWNAVVELPEPNIIGRGSGRTKRDAENAAARDFKQKTEEYMAANGINSIDKAAGSSLSETDAKRFVSYVIKKFGYKAPVFQYKRIGPAHHTLWQAHLIVHDNALGVATRSNKRDAQGASYINGAIELRKKYEHHWEKYEKEIKNKEKTKPAPSVQIYFGDKSHDILGSLVSDLHDVEYFLRNEDEGIIMQSKQLPSSDVSNEPTNLPVKRPRLNDTFLVSKSMELYNRYQRYLNSLQNAPIRATRDSLPIARYASTIVEAIEKNPVIVLVGATGCGKTTQLPQIIFEESIRNGKGAYCNIIVTQPRRIAAISVAQRVAKERAERLGQSIGYTVRFESVPPVPNGSILYCTTGVFLRKMHEDKDGKDTLEGVSHIVVDEVHERDMNCDFLLVILKRILFERRRDGLPPIKLILMSATIDTGIFADYFGEFCPDGKCPVIEVPGRTFPVQQYFLDDLIPMLKSRYQSAGLACFEDKDTKKYVDRELKLAPPLVETPRPPVSKADAQNKYLTVDVDSDDVSSHSSDIDDVEGSSTPSSNITEWSNAPKQIDEAADAEIPYQLMALVIAHVVNTSTEGAILVFLPGLDEIMTFQRQITSTPYPLGINFADTERFKIYVLHSTIPASAQQEVFDPVPSNMRKIILATNIAETSVTIQDIVYVIDSGKVKEKRYDQSKRMTSLMTTWISQSNSRQRSGRAGRVREGEYYALMSYARYQTLEGYSTPEMLRSDLQEICLYVKALDLPATIGDVLAQAIQPPDEASVVAALENLKSLRALDSSEELTPLGKVLATLPMEPGLGKMVLLGAIFQCLDPMLTIAACMASKNPFMSLPQCKQQADQVKVEWAQGLASDHFAILNVYNAWYKLHSQGRAVAAARFCSDNYLSKSGMQTIGQVKLQLLQLLERAGVVPKNNQRFNYQTGPGIGPPELNVNSNCIPLLRALICAGVYPNVSLKTSKKTCRTRHENCAFIHPASVNYKGRLAKAAAMRNGSGQSSEEEHVEAAVGTLYAYSTKVKSSGQQQVFLRDTTKIDPLSVVLFGGETELLQKGDITLLMDEWLQFTGGPKSIRLTSQLKYLLERCLSRIYDQLDVKSHKGSAVNNNDDDDANQSFDADSLSLGCNERATTRLVQGIAELLDQIDRDGPPPVPSYTADRYRPVR
ncbi:6928_t:CDS:1 [Paraglomus occultum]|uniref:RNA helicase n=1 Tax=Paraglomus occultum TaxID=144539 RepID=A0A9N8W7N1_9GLOM|nr:6928_t:CDS:1 [Paraglomus occultum]